MRRVSLNTQQVGRAGELFVAAEIHRRGGYAVTFAGNMPGIDILASDVADERRISIQVKTKTAGSWHARGSRDGAERSPDPDETSFWVLVDLGADRPVYFVVPRWWMQNDIFEHHTAYLARWEAEHGHPRSSDHHAIQTGRVESWRERWDVLGILG